MPGFRTALAALTLSLSATALAQNETLDRIIAVINTDIVLQSELETAADEARGQILARGLSIPPLDVLREQVLERLILVRLQTQRAAQAGIRIDDRELNDVMNNIARQNNLTLAEFAEQLRRDGMDIRVVREQVREELLISRLKQREVDSRVVVTEQDIDLLLAQQGADPDREYQLSHILIAVPDGASAEERQDARAEADRLSQELSEGAAFADLAVQFSDGPQALSGGDLGWRRSDDLPEVFVAAAVELEPGEISPVLSAASGFHLIRLEGTRGGGPRQTITETRAQHILIQANALRTEEQARAQANELYDRIQAGANFDELARELSDDPGSRNAGGDLGWLPPGALVPDFQSQIDGLQPGEVAAPFRTQFGWHIAKLTERRTRDNTDEARRTQVRQAIFQRKAAEEYELWLRRMRDEAYIEYRT